MSLNDPQNPSYFDDEADKFTFKPLGPKNQHPIDLSQKPTLISFVFVKDLSSRDRINGMFALHNTYLVFYGVNNYLIK